jgi:hypothetical protein
MWEELQKTSFLIKVAAPILVFHAQDGKTLPGREIFTNEHGSLLKIWNHCIRVEPLSRSVLRYTDETEMDAGILTLFVWAFAHLFYRHRQRR